MDRRIRDRQDDGAAVAAKLVVPVNAMEGRQQHDHSTPPSSFEPEDAARTPRATRSSGRAVRLARRCLQARRPAVRDLFGFLTLVIGALASMATNLADPPGGEKKVSDEPAEQVVSCESTDDCEPNDENTHCLETYNLCVQCLDDEHCGPQERCFDQVCAASCDSHSDCEGDLVCMDQLCRQCEADSDCGDPSQYCYIGAEFNACRPLCTNTDECTGPGYTEGDVCRGGRCQAVECRVPQDCVVNSELCDNQTGLCSPIR